MFFPSNKKDKDKLLQRANEYSRSVARYLYLDGEVMRFLMDLFRVISIICSYPFGLFMFKRRTFYEDGAPHLPWKRAGALIITNHSHFYDFVMNMYAVFPRKLNVVASELAFKNWFLSFGVRTFGGIQANRKTQDMRFMDTCVELLRRGQLVQIFPEGRFHTDGRIGPFKKSYIVIAHRAGVPIIPVVNDEIYGVRKRSSIIIGKPIYVSDYIKPDGMFPARDERDALDEVIHAKMEELREELEHRKYGRSTRECISGTIQN